MHVLEFYPTVPLGVKGVLPGEGIVNLAYVRLG
jgi:hypothetical protein